MCKWFGGRHRLDIGRYKTYPFVMFRLFSVFYLALNSFCCAAYDRNGDGETQRKNNQKKNKWTRKKKLGAHKFRLRIFLWGENVEFMWRFCVCSFRWRSMCVCVCARKSCASSAGCQMNVKLDKFVTVPLSATPPHSSAVASNSNCSSHTSMLNFCHSTQETSFAVYTKCMGSGKFNYTYEAPIKY